MIRSLNSTSGPRNILSRMFVGLVLTAFAGTLGCGTTSPEIAASETAETAPPRSAISLENGEDNWIVVEGVTRDGATFRFSEVQIDGNGWLVMHPFEDGKPKGDVYVGATYLKSGQNLDVEVTVESAPQTGEMFIVMLHSDVNENQEFDFVFVDERNVLDKAVFEGLTMIAHAIAAP